MLGEPEGLEEERRRLVSLALALKPRAGGGGPRLADQGRAGRVERVAEGEGQDGGGKLRVQGLGDELGPGALLQGVVCL